MPLGAAAFPFAAQSAGVRQRGRGACCRAAGAPAEERVRDGAGLAVGERRGCRTICPAIGTARPYLSPAVIHATLIMVFEAQPPRGSATSAGRASGRRRVLRIAQAGKGKRPADTQPGRAPYSSTRGGSGGDARTGSACKTAHAGSCSATWAERRNSVVGA